MQEIQPLSMTHYSDLFDFEQRNWDYFTQFIPARPESYRDYESFCHAQNMLLMEQSAGKIAFFVLYDKAHEEKQSRKIIARVNLRDISKGTASLGYRMCESVIGKGVATECVSQIIVQAKKLKLHRLNAVVLLNNPASKRVLIKSGFEYSHTEKNAYEFKGEWLEAEHFFLSIGS